MANDNSQEGMLPSILDRLLDPDAAGTAWQRGYSVEQMVDAVHRDLEDLLNTRQPLAGLPEEFSELKSSIFAYGFPDVTSLHAVTPGEREGLARLLETIISRFEPRLKDVHATLLEPGDPMKWTMPFRVEARLCLEPSPEVAFETILELTTGHYSVKPSDSRS